MKENIASASKKLLGNSLNIVIFWPITYNIITKDDAWDRQKILKYKNE